MLMKSHFPVILFLLLAFYHCSSTKKDSTPQSGVMNSADLEKIQTIDSLIQQLVKNQHSAGVTFGVQVGDQTPFFGTYGLADVEQKIPVSAATQFSIASVTKPFTAVAIATLVQEGKLSFQDKIDQFFPEFPNGDQITVYQLLSHTSGIPDWWVGGLPLDVEGEWTIEPDAHKVLESMNTTSIFSPGTKHSYANANFLLLGSIVEQITQQNFDNYLKEAVLQKMGLNQSYIETKGMEPGNWAKGYGINASDSTRSFFVHDFDGYALQAFGAMKTTPKDLLLFTSALFKDQFIAKEVFDQMTAYAKTNNGNYVYDELYFPEGFTPPPPPDHVKQNGYGLGMNKMNTYGKTVLWHSGGMPGFNAIWAYFPESKVTLAMIANTDNGLIPEYENIMKICSEF